MSETISTKKLTIGMYVVLPLSWFHHPFLTNEFVIRSQDQIDKLLYYGLDTVVIDPSRSAGTGREPTGSIQESLVPPKTWEPEKIVPPELREAIRDKSLSPERKSQVVYRSSCRLMERLLQDPKTENIKEAKKGIADIVDAIISDEATSRHLLRITEYDYSTYTHSVNVGVLSVLLAKTLFRKSAAHNLHELGAAFFLHDIGKIRIDSAILNKRGTLTDEEWKIVREHPRHGFEILSETKQLTEECRLIVMHHHERDNGKGYPRGLNGSDVHLYGRICCIADVFDALTSERSYKQKLSTFNALKLMKEEMADHFHNDLFRKFVLLFT